MSETVTRQSPAGWVNVNRDGDGAPWGSATDCPFTTTEATPMTCRRRDRVSAQRIGQLVLGRFGDELRSPAVLHLHEDLCQGRPLKVHLLDRGEAELVHTTSSLSLDCHFTVYFTPEEPGSLWQKEAFLPGRRSKETGSSVGSSGAPSSTQYKRATIPACTTAGTDIARSSLEVLAGSGELSARERALPDSSTPRWRARPYRMDHVRSLIVALSPSGRTSRQPSGMVVSQLETWNFDPRPRTIMM